MISDSVSARSSSVSLQTLLREQQRRSEAAKPARPTSPTPEPVRPVIARIVDWDLVQDGAGNLIAHNVITGVDHILATP